MTDERTDEHSDYTPPDPTRDVVRRDRFSGGPARGFLSSLAADERIFAADLAVDRAHVVMLEEQGIVDAADAVAILEALADVEAAGYDELPDGEDVHAAIETAVVERVGERGGRMHTARSRNDEVAACIRYRLREDLLETVEAVLETREALATVASNHLESVMPGFTHLQPAQPTTVAHYLLSYENALARDTERLMDAFGRVNRSPLGAAAFAGTPFDVDRKRTADLLGFDSVIENAMDAVSTRDFLLETASAVAGVSTTLSGLAEDTIVFSNAGYVELADEYASTSSIMPQKKNPDTMELVRASSGDAAAGVNAILSILKGLPRAYNRDLQRAHPHVFNAVDSVREASTVAAGAVATATWNESILASAAGDGFATATGVADRLAMEGLPFRTAHELVATAATTLESAGDGPPTTDEIYAALDRAAMDVLDDPLTDWVDRDVVVATLDPETSVGSRDSFGGPAPTQLADALDRAEICFAGDRETVDARWKDLEGATEARSAAVSRYT
ncbi:MAG: argininosuccinate lyase [Natronomonas sp.]